MQHCWRHYEDGIRELKILSVFHVVEDEIAAHESKYYATALKALGDGAVCGNQIVEGTA